MQYVKKIFFYSLRVEHCSFNEKMVVIMTDTNPCFLTYPKGMTLNKQVVES